MIPVFPARLAGAGIQDAGEGVVSFRSLRLMVVTWLVGRGMSELFVAALLGHKRSASVTQRNVHIPEAPEEEVVKRFDGRIESAEAVYRNRVTAASSVSAKRKA
jgi:integrase